MSSTTPLRVLFIDDEQAILKAYRRLFGRTHTVEMANSGQAAVDLLTAPGAAFDAVVCDLMMPDLSGKEVYERTLAARPDLAARFVFVSGGAFLPGIQTFLAEVKPHLVDKPVDYARLGALILEISRGR